MKIVLDPSNYTFTPGIVGTGEIDFTNFGAGFDQTRVFAIINTDYNGGEIIFSTGGQGITGGTWASVKLTFNYDTSPMNSSDNLCVIYDDATASQVVANQTQTYDSGNFGSGTPLNALNNSSSAIYCAPYRTAFVQMTNLAGGTARFVPEGSMDGTSFYALPARVLTSTTSSGMVASSTWDPPNNEIIAVALDCNYIRFRTSSNSATAAKLLTYMTQQPYASPWAFNMLLSNSGRVSDWGTGASTSNTLRVVQASDSAVNIPDLMITGTAQTTLNNNLLSGSTVATDVSLYRSISFQVVTSGTVSAGAFFPEQSNDGVNWQTVGYYQNNNAIPSITTSAWNLSTGFNQIYHAALTCRYFRLRISTAVTGGGTALAVARLSPMSHSTGLFGVFGNINANNTQLTGNLFTDINDTLNTITTSTSSSNALALFGTFTVGVRVTALTGTGTPAMDVRIEESFDNANTWIPLYHFERITATGTFYSPPLRATGTHIRYVRVTTGTTISVTSTITRQTKQIASTYIKNLVDRTIAPNTLSSTTPVLMVEGCNKFALIVSSAAGATVNPVIKLQGSEDNSNWYDISGVTVTATPSTTVVSNTGTNEDMPKFIRGIVSSAGTSAVLNYVVLKAQGKP